MQKVLKLWKKAVPPLLALAFVALVAHRIWRTTAVEPSMGDGTRLSEEAERALYLVPGGRYTQADIIANGSLLPSLRYRGFQARHDFKPKPGEMLCPISRTKANAACTWIIDGQSYQFCCPPCIDELVRMAKDRPDELLAPSDYVKR